MLLSKLPNNLYSSFSFMQSLHDSNWFKTKKYKLNCGKLKKKKKLKTLKIALKSPKSPYFFHFLVKNLS